MFSVDTVYLFMQQYIFFNEKIQKPKAGRDFFLLWTQIYYENDTPLRHFWVGMVGEIWIPGGDLLLAKEDVTILHSGYFLYSCWHNLKCKCIVGSFPPPPLYLPTYPSPPLSTSLYREGGRSFSPPYYLSSFLISLLSPPHPYLYPPPIILLFLPLPLLLQIIPTFSFSSLVVTH